MRIGELAARADVSRDTIRFYERNGLIRSAPSKAGSNSYRDYPEDAIEKIAMIREAQHAGFTIAELADFIAQLEDTPAWTFDADAFLEKKIEDVEENIRRARRFLKTLKATRDALSPQRRKQD